LAGIGELGEVFVRGPHLAEGYIGDEERTEQMFIVNPFTKDPHDRLYRTGELGRYLPDGNVEWAGRNDRRVNIRGFRVELEEVETVLKQHPIVQNAAVVLREFDLPKSETPLSEDSDNPKSVLRQAEGSKIENPEASENPKSEIQNPKSAHLVAYIVSNEEDSQSLSDLIYWYVSSRLPDYMVPARFVVLEQLPLTPNGKVDYRALPLVRQIQSSSSNPIASPRNEVEAKLCAIFCQILGREQVGIDENFFRLGGHSLLAAQAAARIREAFGVGLELRTFLEAPTVGALAKAIQFRIKPADTTPSVGNTDREEIEL
jgi:acyl carrier protein